MARIINLASKQWIYYKKNVDWLVGHSRCFSIKILTSLHRVVTETQFYFRQTLGERHLKIFNMFTGYAWLLRDTASGDAHTEYLGLIPTPSCSLGLLLLGCRWFQFRCWPPWALRRQSTPSPLGGCCSWIRDMTSKPAAQRDLCQYLHQTSVSLRRGLHNRLVCVTEQTHLTNFEDEPISFGSNRSTNNTNTLIERMWILLPHTESTERSLLNFGDFHRNLGCGDRTPGFPGGSDGKETTCNAEDAG